MKIRDRAVDELLRRLVRSGPLMPAHVRQARTRLYSALGNESSSEPRHDAFRPAYRDSRRI